MKKNGFTLLELLVVIAILGILVTLASLTYNKVLKLSNENIELVNISEIEASGKKYGTDFIEDIKEQNTMILKPIYLYKKGYLDKDLKDYEGVIRLSLKNEKIVSKYFKDYYTISISVENGTSEEEYKNDNTYTKFFVSEDDYIVFKLNGNSGYGNPKTNCGELCSISPKKIQFNNLLKRDYNFNISYTLGEYLIEYNSNYDMLKYNNTLTNKVIKTTSNNSSIIEIEEKEHYLFSYASCDNNAVANMTNNIVSVTNINTDSICNVNYKKAYKWIGVNPSIKEGYNVYTCVSSYKPTYYYFPNTKNQYRFVAITNENNYENVHIYNNMTFLKTKGSFSMRTYKKGDGYESGEQQLFNTYNDYGNNYYFYPFKYNLKYYIPLELKPDFIVTGECPSENAVEGDVCYKYNSSKIITKKFIYDGTNWNEKSIYFINKNETNTVNKTIKNPINLTDCGNVIEDKYCYLNDASSYIGYKKIDNSLIWFSPIVINYYLSLDYNSSNVSKCYYSGVGALEKDDEGNNGPKEIIGCSAFDYLTLNEQYYSLYGQIPESEVVVDSTGKCTKNGYNFTENDSGKYHKYEQRDTASTPSGSITYDESNEFYGFKKNIFPRNGIINDECYEISGNNRKVKSNCLWYIREDCYKENSDGTISILDSCN